MVDNPSPDQNRLAGWLTAGGLGAVGVIPFAGPLLQATAAEALRQAQRDRDEEWFAMTSARLASLERSGAAIRVDDPSFLAAVNRLHRAARETADERKRELLARAAGNAGSWSATSYEERAEYVELVAELLPIQVTLLAYLDNPRTFASTPNVDHGDRVDLFKWVERLFGLARETAERHIDALEMRALVDVPRGMQYASDVTRQMTSAFGHGFLEFLREGP